jgi:Tfp pilus assembly protein PilF
LKPDFATAHYNLGIARIRSGDTAAAMLSFTNALRCHPGYVDAHTALAEELRRLGDGAGAAEHVRRALELDPQNAKARRLQ